MEEIDVFKSMRESVEDEFSPFVDEKEAARLKLISDHKAWLKKIKKEHPSPYQFFKVGVYIRYFNQTKYENYLDYHKMQFIDLFSEKLTFCISSLIVIDSPVLKCSGIGAVPNDVSHNSIRILSANEGNFLITIFKIKENNLSLMLIPSFSM